MTYTQRGHSYCRCCAGCCNTMACHTVHTQHTHWHLIRVFVILLFSPPQRLLVISCGCRYCCGCVKCQRQGSSALLAALVPPNDNGNNNNNNQHNNQCHIPKQQRKRTVGTQYAYGNRSKENRRQREREEDSWSTPRSAPEAKQTHTYTYIYILYVRI